MNPVLLVALLLLQAPAQPPVRDSRPIAAAGTASISGRVVDAETGEPVAGAMLQMGPLRVGMRGTQTEADDRGQFAVTGLAAGDYIVVVMPPELHATHLPQFVNNDMAAIMTSGPKASVQLKDGERREIVVRLERALALDGRVLDEFGEPMSDVQVMAEGGTMPPFSGGERELTDDRGIFRLFNLAAGTYRVCAIPFNNDWRSGPPPTGGDVLQRRYVKTCYPSAPEGGGERVAVKPTGTPMVTIVMQRVRGYTIAGTVGSEGGLKDVRVSVERVGPIGETTSVRVEIQEGRFTARGVPPGEYTITAEAGQDADAGYRYSAAERVRTKVRVDAADITGLEVVTAKGATVVGRLVPETALPAGTKLRVQPAPGTDLMSFSGDHRPAPVRDDLTFELTGIHEPLMFDVAGLPPGWVVASVRYRGADVTDTLAAVGNGRDPSELEIRVSPRSGQISTRTVDEKGQLVTAALVFMMPAKGDRAFTDQGLFREAKETADGSVEQPPVRPGEYVLLALTLGDLMQVARDPARLATLRPHGQPVIVAAGDRKTVDVVVRPLPEVVR